MDDDQPQRGRRAMRPLWVAAAAVIVIAGLRAGASLLIPLVLSAFLATLSFPVVEWLRRRRVPRLLAVLVTVLVILAAVIGPGLLVAATVREFASAAPAYASRLDQLRDATFAWLETRNIDASSLATAIDPSRALNLLVSTFSGVATFLSVAFLVVSVAAFILYEASVPQPQPESVAPAGWRRHLARIVLELQVYLRVKTIVSVATGLAAGLWVAVLGVDFAMLWGLMTFLLNYIPTLGSIVAAIPPATFALIQFGPASTILVLAGYAGINTLLAYGVEPWLLGRRLRFSPLVVFLAVIVWGWIWGLAGALLAVPMTMATKIALEQSDELRWMALLLEGRTAQSAPPAAVPDADRVPPGVGPTGPRGS